jgi:hypothetical protein
MDDIIAPPKNESSFTPPKLDQINNSSSSHEEEQSETVDLKSDSATDTSAETDAEKSEKNEPKDETPKKPMLLKRLSKKQWLIIGGIAVALLIAGGLIYWFVLKPDSKPSNNSATTTTKKTTVAAKPTSPLTGLTLSSASLASRPVTGLMIENSLAARPQSGLLEAGVVFEAVAEGGITRFLALFQEAQPAYVGPVRSARPYYVDFCLSFDCSYGHVGGSPDAMSDIQSLGVKDIDQFFNSGAYWRTSDREAPHNVYTNFERLDALNQSKGYTSSTFTPFNHKKDVPQTPTASSIDLVISSYLYNAHYQYDVATNTYKRSEGGESHTDQSTGTQIAPKVVIALVMNKGLASDGSHTTYQNIGSGQMYAFQDGIVSEGSWNKADRKSALVFTDKNGLPMKLNTGQVWVSLVGSASDVSYTP